MAHEKRYYLEERELLTAGRSSKTCPGVMEPSPMAILAILTGGFASPK
jgi:hypothetical protein